MTGQPFVQRLSDDREWGFCPDCGCTYLPEFPHRCDPFRAARGIALAVVIGLAAYVAIAAGVISWWLG